MKQSGGLVDPLNSPELKLVRAEKHRQEVENAVVGFGHRNVNSLREEHDAEKGKDQITLEVIAEVSEEPPPDWAPITGDSLTNFRATLDHLVWALSVQQSGDPPPDPEGISFPINETGPRPGSTWNPRGLRSVHADVRTKIESLQPYNARQHDPRSHPLWLLKELSNVDKHRLVHIAHIGAPEGTVQLTPAPNGASTHVHKGPIHDGTVVVRVVAPRLAWQSKVEVRHSITFALAVVIPSDPRPLMFPRVLQRISEAVTGVFAELRPFFA